MKHAGILLSLALLSTSFTGASAGASAGATAGATELWRVWLESPGGQLPFVIDFQTDAAGVDRAFLHNASERIEIVDVQRDSRSLHLGFPHYDSAIDATFSDEGSRFEGRWRKRRGEDRWTDMVVRGQAGDRPRFAEPGDGASFEFAGRWRVDFESEEIDAVGVFESGAGGLLTGTFLTATGDYRYLEGRQDGGVLRLSTFDGAHAFLFVARPSTDGRVHGDFWSSDSWHETWTAERDPDAALPDGFEQTIWKSGHTLGELRFPDLDGNLRALDDPAFAGQARILYVFGSWCPNCSDATELLVEFDRRYRARGLSILGLAFEATGELDRDTRQVRRYARRHRVEYPLLVAGLSDKDEASSRLPILDRVRSYPTTLFLHRDGRVRAIYSGFSGPATGAAHDRLRESFTKIIEELLNENGTDD